MGFLDRLRGERPPKRERADHLYVNDPRFDSWEVAREFGDLESARAWRQHLAEAGIEAVVSSDHELDRFGRGDVYVQVPPERWSEAEEFLSNLDLD